MKLKIHILVMLGLASTARAETGEWVSLFNGKDLNGWTKTLQGLPPGEDPERLVQVHEGAIHMYRDTAEGTKVPFGVVTTDREFSNFVLHLEYRWEGKKFPPRADKLRDAGIIYHVKDAGTIWPAGVECQIQEGDTGDLVFINTGGLTWMNPDPSTAPEGQGNPGQLPETGGIPADCGQASSYIGRFAEADTLDGWNTVEVVVHGSEYAEHTVNGQTLVRLINPIGKNKQALESGKICLQLEGAEIAYRNIKVREIEAPLSPSSRVLSLSAVKDRISENQSVVLTNSRSAPIDTPAEIVGADAAAFKLVASQDRIEAGKEGTWTVAFTPTRGAARYSAALKIGDPADGAYIVLQGIGMAAFEGKNEAPLQDIVHAFGIPLDVGGSILELDGKAATIGASVDSAYFVPAAPGKIRVTPLARFSPPGLTPIGMFTKDDDELVRIGQLADSTPAEPDAHQKLLPSWESGPRTLEVDPGKKPFGFYMEGHHFTSFTDPARPSKAKIPRTVRVYPVSSFQGKPMLSAWLVCFEEASNGDYQDAVILVENIRPVKP